MPSSHAARGLRKQRVVARTRIAGDGAPLQDVHF